MIWRWNAVRAGAAAARALSRPFIFCARADGVMHGTYDLKEAIRRLQAFEAAGADLLYIPVPPGAAELKQIIASVTKPVNALAAGPLKQLTVAEIATIGVRRISTGSQIARLTHAAIRDATTAMSCDHRAALPPRRHRQWRGDRRTSPEGSPKMTDMPELGDTCEPARARRSGGRHRPAWPSAPRLSPTTSNPSAQACRGGSTSP